MHPIRRALFLSLCLPVVTGAQTTLSDDFTATTGAPFTLGATPAAAVQSGDPFGGSFLRLVYDGVNSQNNHWTYPLTAAGAFETITADFDFRVFDAAGNQGADGFHIGFIPTSVFPSGDGPNPTAEEPNFAGYAAFGFDIHPADGGAPVNDVSVHWDGFEQANSRPAPATIDLDNQNWHHARLEVSRVGNSSLARVVLTPNVNTNAGPAYVALEQILPMMLPYENRVQLAGRTGGRDMNVDLDNLQVTWANPFTAILPSTSSIRLLQDFDSLGATTFTAALHSWSAPGINRPGVIPMQSGGARGVFARLAHDGVNTSRNSIAFRQAGPSLSASQRIVFDFRMQSVDNSADGLGLLLLPVKDRGLAGAGPDLAAFEEPNLAGTLAAGIDLYNAVNDVSVHYGTELTNVTVNPATIDLNDGRWHRAEVQVSSAPGGLNLGFTLVPDVDGTPIGPIPAIVNRFLPGVTPYEWRAQLGARTGGAYMNVDVDNIASLQGVKDTALAHTHQDFEGGKTFYEVWKNVGVANSSTYRTEILNEGAANGNFLRLTTAGVGNARNALCLDQTAEGAAAAGTLTVAEWDFRMTAAAGNTDPADGMGFLLIPTAAHGITGPGITRTTTNIGWEEPNFPGVLAVGVDVYSHPSGVNDLSLHWNGAELQNVTLPTNQVDLVSGRFHHAKLMVNWSAATATLVLTRDRFGTPGAPITVLQNLAVPGLLPYDFRVEAAARTGGSTMSQDVDNVLVRTVPVNSFWAWASSYHTLFPPQRDPAADPDGDGQRNLLEYFAALDPSAASPAMARAVDATATSLRFDFRRGRDRPDVSYAYQWSTDLVNWMPPDGTHVFSEAVLNDEVTHEDVRVTVAFPAGEQRLYARIQVTQN